MKILQQIQNWFLGSGSNLSGYLVRDPYPGAWQKNEEIVVRDATAFHAVFSCIMRVAEDVGKLPIGLEKEDENGIWRKHSSPSFSPVLRRPNKFQNSQQFYTQWIISLLSHGNTYVLKERDLRGVVVALYILDPTKVRPVTAGDSYAYEVDTSQINELAGIFDDTILVPPEEMIHDRYAPFGHPLLGISPIAAASNHIGVANEIQKANHSLYKNGSRVSGWLEAAGAISDTDAAAIRDHWNATFAGSANVGKTPVLADGLKYNPMNMLTNADSQTLETQKFTAEIVCSVFAVPQHMVQLSAEGLKYDNIAALNQQYYNQTLAPRLESIEALLNEGLGLSANVTAVFDVTNLLRLDAAALLKAQGDAVAAGLVSPNEARRNLNYGPLPGGDTIYLQQQMWPIERLANRRDIPNDNDNDALSSEAVDKYFKTMDKLGKIKDAVRRK